MYIHTVYHVKLKYFPDIIKKISILSWVYFKIIHTWITTVFIFRNAPYVTPIVTGGEPVIVYLHFNFIKLSHVVSLSVSSPLRQWRWNNYSISLKLFFLEISLSTPTFISHQHIQRLPIVKTWIFIKFKNFLLQMFE